MVAQAPSAHPQRLVIGRVLRPWGLRGGLRIEVLTERTERFFPGAEVYIQDRLYHCRRVRWEKEGLILWLEGVDTLTTAQALRGHLLEIPFTPPPPGRFYHFQVLGLEVWTDTGQFLGHIREVLETGSNDVYVVHGPQGEVLLPAIDAVVQSIDLDRQRMVVHLLPGLLS
ncbi:Ribosome maturation factor RimM [bacterium HR23]|nr:Ribosome maturation factor RimM [bacterium HR23]